VRIGIACEAAEPPAGVIDLFEAAGLPAASVRRERSPALLQAADGLWMLASGPDVLRACDHGRLDLGVVGSDRLLEGRKGTADLLDLRCCHDDLVVALKPGAERPRRRLRVATRHPETTRRHFVGAGMQPDILVMDEPALAPALGLADGVVELASRLARERLGAVALEVEAVVAVCSARLVASRAARVLRRAEIAALTERLRAALEER